MKITGERAYKVFKTHLLLILAVALICFGAAYGYLKFFVDPTYCADAKFYIESANKKGTSGDVTTTRLLAETFVEILNTNSFFKTVHSNLPDGLKEKYNSYSLMAGCEFSIRNSTEVILVRYTDEDQQAVIPVITAILSSLQPHLDVAYGECSSHIVDIPENPSVSSTRTKTVCLLAVIAGSVVAYCFFLLKDMLDIHVRTAEDLISRYNVPVIGTVPPFENPKTHKEVNENGKN